MKIVPVLLLDSRDSVKMIRETLCVAQARILNSPLDVDRRNAHVERLGRLISECDRHRPLGPDGSHGNRHTATCGCEVEPECIGICLTGHDVGVPYSQVVYPHPECELHSGFREPEDPRDAIIAAVRLLHRADVNGQCVTCRKGDNDWVTSPCETERALNGLEGRT